MTVPFHLRTLTEDVLARASEDWVTPTEILSVCLRLGLRNRDDVHDHAIGLIARLLSTGLLVPGDIKDSRHRPWVCDSGEAIARIVVAWSDFSDPFDVRPGDIAWFDTSPEGQRIGEAVLLRESFFDSPSTS